MNRNNNAFVPEEPNAGNNNVSSSTSDSSSLLITPKMHPTPHRDSRLSALPRLDIMNIQHDSKPLALRNASDDSALSSLSLTSTSSSSGASGSSSASQRQDESPLATSRRAPLDAQTPSVHLTTSRSSHRLAIPLPKPGGRPFSPEMITISAKKDDRIDIVADAWHLEENCHFEWHLAFPPRTVDMRSIRAELDRDGGLAIVIRKSPTAL